MKKLAKSHKISRCKKPPKHCCLSKLCGRHRASFDHFSEFDRGRIVAYRDCGLSFREISQRVGWNQATDLSLLDAGGNDGPTWSITPTSLHHYS
ncbi:hypothetical protein TNCV_46381 [Trichonephila clavipes]|nr:hypothetical protein TNCV_46381 [Trichonephila clavipes]